MKRTPDQTYMDLGGNGDTYVLTAVDPEQLPGQTTFDLADPARLFSLIGDGTTYTL